MANNLIFDKYFVLKFWVIQIYIYSGPNSTVKFTAVAQ